MRGPLWKSRNSDRRTVDCEVEKSRHPAAGAFNGKIETVYVQYIQ